MIYEGVEGSIKLKTVYNKFNREYFGKKLPPIQLQWSGKLKVAVGRAMVAYVPMAPLMGKKRRLLGAGEMRPQDVKINMKSLKIQISTQNDLSKEDVDMVMLHEMVHILLYTQRKLDSHHGSSEFDGWIFKLRELTGYEIPLKESTFKRSPNLAAKQGLVAVFHSPDGKMGLSLYSQNLIKKKWLVFFEMITNIVHRSAKLSKVEMYVATHTVISALSAKSALKSISWSYPDGDNDFTSALEIMKTGKKFAEIKKSHSWITPHIAGATDSERNTFQYNWADVSISQYKPKLTIV